MVWPVMATFGHDRYTRLVEIGCHRTALFALFVLCPDRACPLLFFFFI